MANLDQLMQALAVVAILLYLLPRFVGGRVGAALPRIAAAVLLAAIIIALVQTFFWFSK
ncbi:hypothetical protein GJ654_09145 [Rhodoblastus acidophilus]|uniref:Uncharacterized protein n=1 Tax=Rhodoblastus acidophilus TaxID=1074 RepID=A0A6N8DKQ2_RHOAC|nr:hypothetical protein [Rhodoblastus acidophilus]MCW2274389.1 hypothetical protein [Rhodoblastus acidophilus]MTV31160.1 hypothetical protein [Rhodoblastus acidophilus]